MMNVIEKKDQQKLNIGIMVILEVKNLKMDVSMIVN